MKIALVQQHASRDLDEICGAAGRVRGGGRARAPSLVAFAELAFLPFLPQIPAARTARIPGLRPDRARAR